MQFLTSAAMVVLFAAPVVCLAQGEGVKLGPLKTSVTLEGQPIEVSIWGTVSRAHLKATVDLGDFQQHLTPIMAAQLNRSDKCGERLSVEQAALAPSGVLTATVHYERFACAKALGKDIVKRLVGGNAVVEVNLTPTVTDNHLAMTAEVRKIDADGSLGEMLRSGSFGDSLKQKISTSIESSIEKSPANLKSTLPAGMDEIVALAGRAIRRRRFRTSLAHHRRRASPVPRAVRWTGQAASRLAVVANSPAATYRRWFSPPGHPPGSCVFLQFQSPVALPAHRRALIGLGRASI